MSVTAVLDVHRRELCVSSMHADIIQHLLLPGALPLVDRLNDCLSHTYSKWKPTAQQPPPHASWILGLHAQKARKALFNISPIQRKEASIAQDILSTHIEALTSMAKGVVEKVKVEELRHRTASIASNHTTTMISNEFSDQEDDDEEDDEDVIDFMSSRNSANIDLLRNFYSSGDKTSVEETAEASKTTDIGTDKLEISPAKSAIGQTQSVIANVFTFMGNAATAASSTIANNTSTSSSQLQTLVSSEEAAPTSVSNNTNTYMVSSSKAPLLYLSKQSLVGDSDKFFDRFVGTQVSTKFDV